MRCRPVELFDVQSLLAVEGDWASSHDEDMDRKVPAPWAVSGGELLAMVRQRKTSSSHLTRLFVLEDEGEVVGGFCYEVRPDELALVWFCLASTLHLPSGLSVLAEHLEGRRRNRQVAVYLRDQEAARLREVLPFWLSRHYVLELSPGLYGCADGWRLSWPAHTNRE